MSANVIKELMKKRLDVPGEWVRKKDPELYQFFFCIVQGMCRSVTQEEFDSWKCRYRFFRDREKDPMFVLATGATQEKMEMGDINITVALNHVSLSILELYAEKAEPVRQGCSLLKIGRG